jgi:hypothetical protein
VATRVQSRQGADEVDHGGRTPNVSLARILRGADLD